MKAFVGKLTVVFGFSVLLWGCGGTIEREGVSKQQARQLGKADWWDDLCQTHGWYGDGICDEFCPQPDPDCLPPGHRPVCLQQGTAQEGWYWQDDGELIKQTGCADSGPARCVAISSRSEGWAGDEGLIVYDPDCHRTVGIALWGESCGEDGGECYQEANLFCNGAGVCRSDGTCEQDADCSLPGNEWSHARCIGYPVCQEGSCAWICGQPPEPGPWSWTEMLLAEVESDHPYPNDCERQWVVERQGASRIKLHLASVDIEPGYDWLLIEGAGGQQFVVDGRHQDLWTPAFDGDRVTLTLKSDASVTGQGFVADRVAIYEQLPGGQCNRDEDCRAGQYCRPHQCLNPYAPCHGDCLLSTPVSFEATDTPLDIPDNDPAGVGSTILVERLPGCTDPAVEITLQITHSYVGDLSIHLATPDGSNVWLYDRQGGSSDDLQLTLDLAGVLGADEGSWTLHVADLAALDAGRLEAWSLDFTCR